MLNPALRPVWRDAETLQLGIDPERALVLTGIDEPRARFLSLLDGSRTRPDLVAGAAASGVRPADAAALIDLLAEGGALLDGSTDHRPLARISAAERDRLGPDLAAWSLAPEGPGSATRTFQRRRGAVVGVQGAGRVGATLVGLLAAAGVGELAVDDERPLRAADLAPGGAAPVHLEQPRGSAALAAARTSAPGTRAGSWAAGRADLVVLCPDGAHVDPVERGRLLATGTPHLLAHTYERVGAVGPLVVPGRTPCLHCLDLHRVDRDGGWPLVAAQLAGPGRQLTGLPTAAACDVVLATSVAALAATTALAFLDDPRAGHELAGARLELRPPDGRTRRRSWGIHPACGCDWDAYPDDAVRAG
ncbi:MAG TPA: thiamine biosynthesis protein ThiF [Actinomycetes bacterium]